MNTPTSVSRAAAVAPAAPPPAPAALPSAPPGGKMAKAGGASCDVVTTLEGWDGGPAT